MISHRLFLIFLMTAFLVITGKVSFAENMDPFDDDSQYAWGENVGWLNAEPSGDGGPGVKVEDFKLTGYIWAENIGWVSLSCENTASCGTVNYEVTNDGNGNLSGYAWGENVGWISFSCENTGSCRTVDYGVMIEPATGEFSGLSWGENIGWITFRSTGAVSYGVTTLWPEVTEDCEGDFKPDDDVDGLDLDIFNIAYGIGDLKADLDNSGVVDTNDLVIFAAEFGRIDCL